MVDDAHAFCHSLPGVNVGRSNSDDNFFLFAQRCDPSFEEVWNNVVVSGPTFLCTRLVPMSDDGGAVGRSFDVVPPFSRPILDECNLWSRSRNGPNENAKIQLCWP